MNKDMRLLVERLERTFPHLLIRNESYFESGLYYPQNTLSWYDFIAELKLNGLEIKNIK